VAGAATRYWRMRIDFEGAISYPQPVGMPEGRSHPAANPEDHYPLVERSRAALVKQLFTPARDLAAVKWKQAQLARGQYRYTDVKPERIERAVATDLEFLAAHPVRQSDEESSRAGADLQPAADRRARKAAEAIAGLQKRGKPRLGEAGLSNKEAEGGDRALHE
jgi:hypothetical protein